MAGGIPAHRRGVARLSEPPAGDGAADRRMWAGLRAGYHGPPRPLPSPLKRHGRPPRRGQPSAARTIRPLSPGRRRPPRRLATACPATATVVAAPAPPGERRPTCLRVRPVRRRWPGCAAPPPRPPGPARPRRTRATSPCECPTTAAGSTPCEHHSSARDTVTAGSSQSVKGTSAWAHSRMRRANTSEEPALVRVALAWLAGHRIVEIDGPLTVHGKVRGPVTTGLQHRHRSSGLAMSAGSRQPIPTIEIDSDSSFSASADRRRTSRGSAVVLARQVSGLSSLSMGVTSVNLSGRSRAERAADG